MAVMSAPKLPSSAGGTIITATSGRKRPAMAESRPRQRVTLKYISVWRWIAFNSPIAVVLFGIGMGLHITGLWVAAIFIMPVALVQGCLFNVLAAISGGPMFEVEVRGTEPEPEDQEPEQKNLGPDSEGPDADLFDAESPDSSPEAQ